MNKNAKERILSAADELFGTVGFDAATTREIAEKSGVNKALIHYHFQSKQGLLTELLDRYYSKLGGKLAKALTQDGDIKTRLLSLIDVYIEFLVENRNFGRIVQREAAGGAHMERIAGHMAPIFSMGIQTLKDVYPKTQQGEAAAEHLLISFYGAIISYFTYGELISQLLGDDPMSDESIVRRKQHLKWMASTLLDSVEGEAP